MDEEVRVVGQWMTLAGITYSSHNTFINGINIVILFSTPCQPSTYQLAHTYWRATEVVLCRLCPNWHSQTTLIGGQAAVGKQTRAKCRLIQISLRTKAPVTTLRHLRQYQARAKLLLIFFSTAIPNQRLCVCSTISFISNRTCFQHALRLNQIYTKLTVKYKMGFGAIQRIPLKVFRFADIISRFIYIAYAWSVIVCMAPQNTEYNGQELTHCELNHMRYGTNSIHTHYTSTSHTYERWECVVFVNVTIRQCTELKGALFSSDRIHIFHILFQGPYLRDREQSHRSSMVNDSVGTMIYILSLAVALAVLFRFNFRTQFRANHKNLIDVIDTR